MNKRLFVGGLPYSLTNDELSSFFSQAGTVVSVSIISDRDTGRSKGFGFVEMATEEEASAAIAKCNGADLAGRKLIVSEAKPMEKREFSSDRRGGGFGDHRGNSSGGRRYGNDRSQRGGGKRW